MPYQQRRTTAPTNVIKLTFDYDTLDRLKAEAAARKVDWNRCAYELIQEQLGVRQSPSIGEPMVEPEDDVTASVKRGIDAIRRYPSQHG